MEYRVQQENQTNPDERKEYPGTDKGGDHHQSPYQQETIEHRPVEANRRSLQTTCKKVVANQGTGFKDAGKDRPKSEEVTGDPYPRFDWNAVVVPVLGPEVVCFKEEPDEARVDEHPEEATGVIEDQGILSLKMVKSCYEDNVGPPAELIKESVERLNIPQHEKEGG